MAISLFLGLVATNGSQNHWNESKPFSPYEDFLFNVPIVKFKSEKKDDTDEILRYFVDCESGGDNFVVNWNDKGSPSYGLLQFKKQTWIFQIRKYNLFPATEDEELMNLIYDPDIQIKLARLMIMDGGQNHWKTCYDKYKVANK